MASPSLSSAASTRSALYQQHGVPSLHGRGRGDLSAIGGPGGHRHPERDALRARARLARGGAAGGDDDARHRRHHAQRARPVPAHRRPPYVSRIVAGKMRLEVRSVDLPAVLEAALDAVRPAAEAKEIRLQTLLDPAAGPVQGDSDRLQQIAWNLLMNAVKFTPKGGRIQIVLQRVTSGVEIVVSDTGLGIRREVLPHIFERFRQGDMASTRSQTGLGIGLALVRHLTELHGGTVSAESAGEGKGATFRVHLAITTTPSIDPMGDQTAVGVPKPAYTGPSLSGLRVLVVDDDIDALTLV